MDDLSRLISNGTKPASEKEKPLLPAINAIASGPAYARTKRSARLLLVVLCALALSYSVTNAAIRGVRSLHDYFDSRDLMDEPVSSSFSCAFRPARSRVLSASSVRYTIR